MQTILLRFFSHKWPLHVSDDGKNIVEAIYEKKHSKIVCIKLVHLPYLYI